MLKSFLPSYNKEHLKIRKEKHESKKGFMVQHILFSEEMEKKLSSQTKSDERSICLRNTSPRVARCGQYIWVYMMHRVLRKFPNSKVSMYLKAVFLIEALSGKKNFWSLNLTVYSLIRALSPRISWQAICPEAVSGFVSGY